MRRILTLLAVFALFSSVSRGDDVAGWRGNGTAKYEKCQPPQAWDVESENILWKTEIGRGYSSPVLYGNNIWVTANPSDIICLDAMTGKEKWRFSAGYAFVLGEEKAKELDEKFKTLDQKRRDARREYDQLRKSEPDSPILEELKKRSQEVDRERKEFEKQFPRENRGGAGNSAATALCDGSRLYVVFGTGVVIALTLDGKPLWSKHLEVPQQGFGHSSSPMIAQGKLIVHIQNLVALDPKTGKVFWTTKVPAKFGTPSVASIKDKEVIITPAGFIVDAFDGSILSEKSFRLSNNSPLVEGDTIYAHESGKIKAFRLPRSLDPPFQLDKLWETRGTGDQRMATAVYHDGLLYSAGRKGVIEVVDAKNGQMIYQQRSKIGEIFSSPVIAGDLVFLSGKDGKTLVFRSGREFQQVALNKLERINSLPVFHQSKMFVRGDKHLYCIGK